MFSFLLNKRVTKLVRKRHLLTDYIKMSFSRCQFDHKTGKLP